MLPYADLAGFDENNEYNENPLRYGVYRRGFVGERLRLCTTYKILPTEDATKILTESAHRVIIHKDNTVYRKLYAKLWSLERFSTMERIKTIATRDLTKSVVTGGCGECQTSCQSACKTSCGVANQKCENSNK